MKINGRTKDFLDACLCNYYKIKGLLSEKQEICEYKQSRKIKFLQIDETVVGWIAVIDDMISNEKDIIKDIFINVFLKQEKENHILSRLSLSRSTYQRLKAELFLKTYCLGIAKGIVNYQEILNDEINR